MKNSLSWILDLCISVSVLYFNTNKQRKNKTLAPGTCFHIPSLPAGWGRRRDVHLELSDLCVLPLGQVNCPVLSGSIANATSSVKSTWNSLLGLRSPFLCLPDFGYACITLWLQLLGSLSLGPKNVHFWRQGRYIICWSQCKIKMRGLLFLEKRFFPLSSAVPPSLPVLVFPICYSVSHSFMHGDPHKASTDP